MMAREGLEPATFGRRFSRPLHYHYATSCKFGRSSTIAQARLVVQPDTRTTEGSREQQAPESVMQPTQSPGVSRWQEGPSTRKDGKDGLPTHSLGKPIANEYERPKRERDADEEVRVICYVIRRSAFAVQQRVPNPLLQSLSGMSQPGDSAAAPSNAFVAA